MIAATRAPAPPVHAPGSQPLLRSVCGRTIVLRPDVWLGSVDHSDRGVLARAVPPVIDVGCGPGRHLLHLCRRGMVALGIDPAPNAVRLARLRGAPVLERSVFDPLPCEGRWRSALVLDGNIGIGGSPTRLLRRLLQVVSPTGRLIVEVEPPGVPTEELTVRIEHGTAVTPWFAWARVGADAVSRVADLGGWTLADRWSSGSRWFAELDPA